MAVGVLEGKIAAVAPGASSGSGLGIARRFVEEGATTLLLARGGERLEQTAKDLGEAAIPFVTDDGDPVSVGRTFAAIGDRFGRVDILVNNAAVYRPCRVELLSDFDIQQPDRHQPGRSCLHVPGRHPAVTGRWRRRHRQHVERIDTASVPHAVHVRGHQGGSGGVRSRFGAEAVIARSASRL